MAQPGMAQPHGQRFDAFKLAASQGEISGTIAPGTLERLEDRVAEVPDGVPQGQISWSIRGTADEQLRPAITVSIEGSVRVECQRCLEMLDQAVSQTTMLLLARNDAELLQLDEGSEREVLLANAPLDPVTLVEDELLLTLPFAPRHETGCEPAGAPAE